MTVNELISALQKLPDQNATVLVNVKTHTKVWGVAQVTPFAVDRSYQGATIWVTLPDGMYAVQRGR